MKQENAAAMFEKKKHLCEDYNVRIDLIFKLAKHHVVSVKTSRSMPHLYDRVYVRRYRVYVMRALLKYVATIRHPHVQLFLVLQVSWYLETPSDIVISARTIERKATGVHGQHSGGIYMYFVIISAR